MPVLSVLTIHFPKPFQVKLANPYHAKGKCWHPSMNQRDIFIKQATIPPLNIHFGSQPVIDSSFSDPSDDGLEVNNLYRIGFSLPENVIAGGDHLIPDIAERAYTRQRTIFKEDPESPSPDEVNDALHRFLENYNKSHGALNPNGIYLFDEPVPQKPHAQKELNLNKYFHNVWDVRQSEAVKVRKTPEFRSKISSVLTYLKKELSQKLNEPMNSDDILKIWIALVLNGTTVSASLNSLLALKNIAEDPETCFINMTHPYRAIMLSGQLTALLTQLDPDLNPRKVASIANYRFLELFPPEIQKYLKAAGFTGVDAWSYSSGQKIKPDLDQAIADFIQNRAHIIVYPEHAEGLLRVERQGPHVYYLTPGPVAFNPATANLVYRALLEKGHVKIVSMHSETPSDDLGRMDNKISSVGKPLYLIRDPDSGKVSFGYGYKLSEIKPVPLNMCIITREGFNESTLICDKSNTPAQKQMAVRVIAYYLGIGLGAAYFNDDAQSVILGRCLF